MKRIGFLPFLLLAALAARSALAETGSVVAVLPFEGSGLPAADREALRSLLENELVRSGAFTVVERFRIDALLSEQSLQLSGIIDEAGASRVGRLLAAGRVALGSVQAYSGGLLLSLRLVDVGSGTIAGSAAVRGRDLAEIERGIPGAAAGLAPRPGADSAGDMAAVKGGTFTMGDDTGEGKSYERPAHTVTVSDFLLARRETTQAEWAAVMGANPSTVKGESLPVDNVSFYDAVEYCNRRSAREGRTPCYSYAGSGTDASSWPVDWKKTVHDGVACDFEADGYRLPTEAEWEFAARGGAQSKRFRYPGGDDAAAIGWIDSNAGGAPHPVGQKRSNELGLHDMGGNVWEWVWDWYEKGYYAKSPQRDPRGGAPGAYRGIRGGSWRFDASHARAASKGNGDPTQAGAAMGLRVARSR